MGIPVVAMVPHKVLNGTPTLAGAPIVCFWYHLGIPGVAMVPHKVLNSLESRMPGWKAMKSKIPLKWVVKC